MIKQIDIIDALSAALANAFPAYKIYIDLCPEGFIRPCFCLRRLTVRREDVNRNTIQEKSEYLLGVHENVDDYANSSTLRLLETQQAVLDLFRVPAFQVGDRWLRIQAEGGDREFNVALVTLRIEYFDLRETPAIEEDKIQEVKMRIKKEE